MNELQLSLLAIGVVVIFAVLAFNRWQERKYRRQSEQQFASQGDDILLNAAAPQNRVEPVLDVLPEKESDLREASVAEPETEPAYQPAMAEEIEETEPVVAAIEPAQDEVEAEVDAIPFEPEKIPAPIVAQSREDALEPDSSTEYIATLSASEPIAAHALMPVLQQLKSVGKPLRWLGQRQQYAKWEDVVEADSGTEFIKLAACMQLADRNGPARREEVDAFCDMTQAVAANLYAVIDCPDKQTALASAAELDQFCADVDVLIGFNIISKDGAPFAGTKLRGLAESAGMKLMPDGSFHYLNDHGAQLFSLTNLEPAPFSAEGMKHLATHGVTFLFDVPKASGGVQAFNQMLLAARLFIGPLSALMVDDNRRELTDSGIDTIRQQLVAIYAKMEQHDIRPGSPRSKRLFA